MRRAVRVGLVVLGAALAVYGAASLTGGWLGTPPWWQREETATEYRDRVVGSRPHAGGSPGRRFEILPGVQTVPREGRAWISAGVVAVGLALVAWGASPRRRRAVTS